MTLLQALVLGLVQGLTQFLPVSAEAHLRIVPALFGWRFHGGTGVEPGVGFIGIMQLGTTAAILVYFWRELLQVSVAWIRGLYDRSVRGSLEYRLGWYLILATIPAVALGVIFTDRLEAGGRNLWLVAGVLIGFGLLLGVAERIGRRRREEEGLNRLDAIVVGTAQTVALIPGASRSATTIAAGLFRGLTREAAVRFSFLLSVPAVVLFGVYGAVRAVNHPTRGPGTGLVGVAVIVAFVVGLGSLAFFVRWVTNHSTLVFVCYRIALGVLVLVLLYTGTLRATA
ncbi:MAG: undecaprenyl-diphosphatase [Jatrophihabitans sp.]|nr:MAG: undecaprenyl-diphosphatase [Jatrophihabitans sp.]